VHAAQGDLLPTDHPHSVALARRYTGNSESRVTRRRKGCLRLRLTRQVITYAGPGRLVRGRRTIGGVLVARSPAENVRPVPAGPPGTFPGEPVVSGGAPIVVFVRGCGGR